MKYKILILSTLLWATCLQAQKFEAGITTTFGPANTTFRGNLSDIAGFSKLEISKADVDTAFARFDLSAPRWLKDLFPGVKIEIEGEVARQLTRNVRTTRFFARYHFIGGSFAISDPRLTTPEEARKLKNQVKSVRLALAGDAEALAVHLAVLALADGTRVKPFFNNRYDLEGYVHLKQLFMGDQVLLEWGKDRRNSLTFDVTAGLRLTADPSPVLDLGSVLFVRDRLDDLMEGGILAPLENLTDRIAEAIQNVVFGRFRDPRTVPSVGWFLRGEVPVNFGGGFSVLAGTELSIQRHTNVKGVQPMYSAYGYAGMRWNVIGTKRRS
jgi:hypothetical protein